MHMFTGLSRCPVCRKNPSSGRGCCAPCAADLFTAHSNEHSVSLGHYSGKLEQAVRAFKFHGATRLGALFAQELTNLIKAQGWSVDAVCAVPLHRRRFLTRGYNQSFLLAQGLARGLGASHLQLLQRTRNTAQQARLGRQARLENVADAFELRPVARSLRGKHVLLVDDVMTSGATLQACRDTLLRAGISSVKLATIAKARTH